VLYSGSQDTYIITYDLVADQAQYKLMGHKDAVSNLVLFEMKLPNQKQPTKVLVSSSKDGFIKLWDLSVQYCLHTYSDPILAKVNDFVLIPELRLLVVGNASQSQQDSMYLNLYQIVTNPATGQLELKAHSKVKKASTAKAIEMHYDQDQ
jgi:WD40 repeat protein